MPLSITFYTDGATILTGSHDHTARLWETASGMLLATLQGHADVVTKVASHLMEHIFLTDSRDDMPRLWKTASGQCVGLLQGDVLRNASRSFSPDGTACAHV